MELVALLVFLFANWLVFHFLKFFFIERFREGGIKGFLEEEEAKEREEVRRFRTEITSGIFIDTVKKVERERPLTDEELDLVSP